MPFFLDTQETSQRFGTQIGEFCSLLDTNHIHHGSPNDLFEFARVLERSNQFRNDLSALVKSVVWKADEELLLTDMMSIIAASVGGPSFTDTQADFTKPTNTLMEFLLGTGCWSHFGSPSPTTSKSTAPPLRPSVRPEQPRPMRISSPAPTAPIASENLEERAGLLDVSSDLRQTLNRLEINTLQVKLHLDSIEKRIGRIEPSPDSAPAPTPPQPEPLPHSNIAAGELAQSPAEDVPGFEAELPTRGRAVFSREPQPLQTETDDFSSPTFAYAAEGGRSIIPIGVFLVLLAIIAAALLFAHSGSGRTFLQAGMSRLKNVHAPFTSAPATPPPVPATTSPPAPAPSSGPAAAPVSPVAPAKNMAETTPTHPSVSDGASPNTSPDLQPVPNPKITYVQSNVMEGHLLSAPRPEYPSSARSAHIEGTVALQATISRSGSIKTLHAIKGPPVLRVAAVDAVRHWRYKPYSIDGRPVEVATTVYVHFSLKPPPVIAR